MARVFLSYRRADTQHIAGRLYDHLIGELGEGSVFRDVVSIGLGDDFRESIFEAIGQSDVSLVLIGDEWLAATDDEGQQRLDDPDDFVRLEVEASLRRNIPVIPILTRDAVMPAANELPLPLRRLAYRQAAPLRPDPDFARDVERITRWITAGRGPGVFGYDPRVYLGNLGMVAGLLLFIVLWFARYTDWFSGGAGNAAAVLGGFFALLGVVLKVIPDARIRPVRSWIEKRLLIHPKVRFVLLGLFVAATVAFSFFGAVEIRVPAGDSSREIVFVESGDETPSPLTAGRRVETFRTAPWSPRRLVVDVKGLPRRAVTLYPWQVIGLTVPRSFLRPVLLVRCESLVVASTAAESVDGRQITYRVLVDGAEVARGPFSGHTLCLGASPGIGIPDRVRADWQHKLEAQGSLSPSERDLLGEFWFRVADGLELDLPVGASLAVEVWVKLPAGEPFLFGGSREIVLQDPNQDGVFPQTLALRAR